MTSVDGRYKEGTLNRNFLLLPPTLKKTRPGSLLPQVTGVHPGWENLHRTPDCQPSNTWAPQHLPALRRCQGESLGYAMGILL